MGEASSQERANYHLSFGKFLEKLRNANPDSEVDKRIIGIGSYRGYYIDIALYTEESGFTTTDEEQPNNIDNYKSYSKEHHLEVENLPRKAGELYKVLSELLDKRYFTGYKGGEFLITYNKPLWLATDCGDCSDIAITDLTDDLQLITKKIED